MTLNPAFVAEGCPHTTAPQVAVTYGVRFFLLQEKASLDFFFLLLFRLVNSLRKSSGLPLTTM